MASKSFIIFLVLAIGFGYYSKSCMNGIIIMGIYVIIKLIWGFLTRR